MFRAVATPDHGSLDLCSLDCARCPVGLASGGDRGQFCPWVTRDHAAGEVLGEAGDAADYVWFVKDGVVGLREPGSDRLASLRAPGSFVGLECLTAARRPATAVVLTPSLLCGATREGFIAWLGGSPERVGVVVDAAERDRTVVLPESDHDQ